MCVNKRRVRLPVGRILVGCDGRDEFGNSPTLVASKLFRPDFFSLYGSFSPECARMKRCSISWSAATQSKGRMRELRWILVWRLQLLCVRACVRE